MSKNQWTGRNVLAYLVFQAKPACFEPAQWAEWKHYADAAARGVGDNGGIGPNDLPPHCSDCTRTYQAAMRKVGLCGHPEVKFLRNAAYLDPHRFKN